MEKITTASRIHPLMAAAALSVITVSAFGTAAIAGLLPNSKAQTVQSAAAIAATPTPAQQLLEAQQLLAAQQQLATQQQLVAQQQLAAQQAAAAPVVAAPVRMLVAEAPKAAPKPKARARVAPRPTRVVYRDAPQRSRSYNDSPRYQAQAPAAQPRQPNYVGIAGGAVIGGLLGNQIGGGNGKKLATVAGIIGGGYLGNEVANRYQHR